MTPRKKRDLSGTARCGYCKARAEYPGGVLGTPLIIRHLWWCREYRPTYGPGVTNVDVLLNYGADKRMITALHKSSVHTCEELMVMDLVNYVRAHGPEPDPTGPNSQSWWHYKHRDPILDIRNIGPKSGRALQAAVKAWWADQ